MHTYCGGGRIQSGNVVLACTSVVLIYAWFFSWDTGFSGAVSESKIWMVSLLVISFGVGDIESKMKPTSQAD